MVRVRVVQSTVAIPRTNEDLVVQPVEAETTLHTTLKQLSRAEVEPVLSQSDNLLDMAEVRVILRPVQLVDHILMDDGHDAVLPAEEEYKLDPNLVLMTVVTVLRLRVRAVIHRPA